LSAPTHRQFDFRIHLNFPRNIQKVAYFPRHGHRIRALTLDLAQPWPKIHACLMQIVSIDASVPAGQSETEAFVGGVAGRNEGFLIAKVAGAAVNSRQGARF
jgi:hypothetical protein